jgi:cytochrome c
LAYGKSWDVNELNGFLLNPKKWIPNNKMSFAGMKKPEDRAAVILWMNENSDSPLPLQ